MAYIPYLSVIALQVTLLVHAVRSGRTQPWLYIIVFLPLVGSIAYFVAEILPEMMRSREAHKAVEKVRDRIDPERGLRETKFEAELSGSVDAKHRLAEEHMRRGNVHDAVALYRSITTGMFGDDPKMLLGYAEALVASGDFAGAQGVLDRLQAERPGFQSAPGHLLYARALEGQGRNGEARQEYEAVIKYFPGPEAKCRYADFLDATGDRLGAREMMEQVVRTLDTSPKHVRRMHSEWYSRARKRLAEGPAGPTPR